jgi:hypothetical protein
MIQGNISANTRASRRDVLSKENIEFQAKRIKFTVRKSAGERLFTQLQDVNERMRKLTESSDKTGVARHQGQTTKPSSVMSRKMDNFWQHAKRLHEALSTAWQCSCVGHTTNLGLQHRTSDKIEFEVVFQLGNGPQQFNWQGTRIKMEENASAVAIHVPQVGATSSTFEQHHCERTKSNPGAYTPN